MFCLLYLFTVITISTPTAGVSVISKVIPVGNAIKVDPKLTEDDILIPKRLRNFYASAAKWPNAIVPYAIDKAIAPTSTRYSQIMAAIGEYHKRTCIKWIRKSSYDKNYINFMDGGPLKCSSYIGMIGGAQALSIGEGCDRSVGVILHEMLHALGILHEHTRPDRDKYIDVIDSKIQSGKEAMFLKIALNETDLQDLSYDYSSVMHYGNASFSIDGLPTILTKDKSAQQVIGQRLGFSVCDLEKINKKYACVNLLSKDSSCQPSDVGLLPTTPPGAGNQNSNCENDPSMDCNQVIANPNLCAYAPGYFILYCRLTCNNCDSKICMDSTSSFVNCVNVVKPCAENVAYFCPKSCGWCW